VTEVVIAFKGGRAWRQHQQAAKRPPTRRYPARVARQLALAHALQRRVDDGEFTDYADMARALGFSRARVSQIMDLLLLAPAIQEEILFLEVAPGAQPISERALRKVCRHIEWPSQRRVWAEILSSIRGVV
jgi:ParB-like chromosome segregation protein Spo0J